MGLSTRGKIITKISRLSRVMQMNLVSEMLKKRQKKKNIIQKLLVITTANSHNAMSKKFWLSEKLGLKLINVERGKSGCKNLGVDWTHTACSKWVWVVPLT